MAGLWEFPGGKCEPGESAAEAAGRECREELGLEVRIGPLRLSTAHGYPHGRVELYYFDGDVCNPSESPNPETGFHWVTVDELLRLDFPEANSPVLTDLGRNFGESKESPTE